MLKKIAEITFTDETEEQIQLLSALENIGYQLVLDPDYSNTYYLIKDDAEKGAIWKLNGEVR